MGVLAIHAGSTEVTAVVVTPDGRIEATAGQELARHSPSPGWVEHAPEEIWQATLAAVREVLTRVDRTSLTAIGITNQRDTVLLWDRETLGSPRRAITGDDRRTDAICAHLHDEGHADRVGELTGLSLSRRFAAPTLRWLAEHEPHTWALVESGRYAVGTVESYLVARMTRGTYHVTDVSNASRTLLFDVTTGDWSDELCGIFGVPRDALPELVPSWGEVATTDPRTFLDLRLPIAGIAGDRPAAHVGQSCAGEGDSTCSYGVVASVLTTTGPTLTRADGLLTTAAWRSPDGELTYALEASTTEASAGARATAQTVAAEVRDLLDAMPAMPASLSALRVDGAPSADDLLCQVQADHLGVPVERPELVDTAALGAAFLAGLGTGVWGSADELTQIRQPDRTFAPRDGRPDTSAPADGRAAAG